MKTLSESERREIKRAIVFVDTLPEPSFASPSIGYRVIRAVRPILDYAKEPQNFPDPFIETQALNIARAINS